MHAYMSLHLKHCVLSLYHKFTSYEKMIASLPAIHIQSRGCVRGCISFNSAQADFPKLIYSPNIRDNSVLFVAR